MTQSKTKNLAMRFAGSTYRNGPDSPKTIDLRIQLNEEKIRAYIEKTLADAPPFSDEQIAKLSALLRPADAPRDGAGE